MNGTKFKREAAKGLRYTHIRVANWRNFSQVDTPLQRRMFLVGPNASGKSNFLDIFRFLYDIVSIGGGFQEAVRKRGGVSSLRSLHARRYSNVEIHLSIGIGEGDNLSTWEYEIHFNQDNLRRPILKRERVVHDEQETFLRPNSEDKSDAARLSQTYLEQINVNRDFREIVEFVNSTHYLHIVPQLIREPDRSVGRRNDPYGGDFLEQVAHVNARTRDARLRRIKNALQVVVPQLAEIGLHKDEEKGTPHLRARYEHWRPKGAWQNEEQFSDGTLRLLGLLWAVLDGGGPLLLEEPELSLHPEVVRLIPQMLARAQSQSRRQIILSTHSSDLLGDTGIGLDEVLMLFPSNEGTQIQSPTEISRVKELLQGGMTLADIVIPHTRPQKAEQLSLFG